MSMGEDGSSYSEMNNFTSALPDVIHSGFSALHLMQYFTVGKDEVRAWPVRRGASAPEAAGCIHTDFEKAFQTVEVVKFEEFLAHKEENPEYKPLKFSKFGKKYIVEDGDILQFLVCTSFVHLVLMFLISKLLDNTKEINSMMTQDPNYDACLIEQIHPQAETISRYFKIRWPAFFSSLASGEE